MLNRLLDGVELESDMQVKLIGDSDRCERFLSLYTSPVMTCKPVQRVPRFSSDVSWRAWACWAFWTSCCLPKETLLSEALLLKPDPEIVRPVPPSKEPNNGEMLWTSRMYSTVALTPLLWNGKKRENSPIKWTVFCFNNWLLWIYFKI